MYEIAKYLTEEQRRAAAAEVYTPDSNDFNKPRNQEGYCPLGIALPSCSSKAPWSGLIASTILGLETYPTTNPKLAAQWDKIINAAYPFIIDWDDGKIRNLAAALGVEPEES